MNHWIHTMLQEAQTPCYWLSASGDFLTNAGRFAQEPSLPEASSIEDLLRRFGTRNDMHLGEALRQHGLTLMPFHDGRLALAGPYPEMPLWLFSKSTREPLTDLFALAHSLQGKLEEEDAGLLDSLQTSAYSLLRLTSNFEGFSRPVPQDHPGPVDLGELVQAMAESTEALQRRPKVPIRVSVPTGTLLVQADRDRLCTALLNLLRNSIQFSRDGNCIDISLKQVGKRAVLTVQDRGLGMRDEVKQRAFEPFFSRDPYGDSTERPGLGLGLAAVRAIVTGLGGTLTLESTFGEGTTLSLALPLHQNGGEDVLRSGSADYNEYLRKNQSPLYIQLAGYCYFPL